MGYPFRANVIRAGDVVLDVGSGSGTDAVIASRRTGPRGRVYALDVTEAMRRKLSAIVSSANAANVEILAGSAEAIPLPDASVDVVITNGVLNLVPDKARAIEEIHRVLKPGGRLVITDIALGKPVPFKYRQDPEALGRVRGRRGGGTAVPRDAARGRLRRYRRAGPLRLLRGEQ